MPEEQALKTPTTVSDAPIEEPKAVEGEVILTRPTRVGNRTNHPVKYRPEYCQMILDMYDEMLAASDIKIMDEETLEQRSKALREKEQEAATTTAVGINGDPIVQPKRRAKAKTVESRQVKRTMWRYACAELPNFNRFGRLIGVSSSTLISWRKQYPSFDEACEMATDQLQDAIVQRGLTGQYDADFAKFVGKNWARMTDRHEVTGADGAPLNPPPELRLIPIAQLEEAEKQLLELKRRLLTPAAAPQQSSGGETPHE